MADSVANLHRGWLGVLFFIFEVLFVTSVVILTRIDFQERLALSDAAGISFWFSFVGLFIVSYLMRRSSRYLTIIGWVTLFAGFCFAALFSFS